MELCSVFCGSLDGRGVWGRVDTCICMAESFCCPPETITLLIDYAAATAKSLQSCLTVRPQRRQPTRLPHPWDSPGKNTGVGCRFLLQCRKVRSESEVAQSCPTLSNPMDCSRPGSSIHGIFQARVLEWGAIAFSICISEVFDISPRNLDSSLCFPQPSISHDVLRIEVK